MEKLPRELRVQIIAYLDKHDTKNIRTVSKDMYNDSYNHYVHVCFEERTVAPTCASFDYLYQIILNPVSGPAFESLNVICSGYDTVNRALVISQGRVFNLLRAQEKQIDIKLKVIACSRISSIGSGHQIGLLYRGLHIAAVSPGITHGDLVIDLPSPPADSDLAPERMSLLGQLAMNALHGFDIHISFNDYSDESSVTFIAATDTIIYKGLGIHHFDELRFLTILLGVREFVLQDSSVESSTLRDQFWYHPIARYTLRNVKLYTRLAFGHRVPCPWKGHIGMIAGSSFVDSVLLEDLWTPSYFEDVDPELCRQPKVKQFEAHDQWSVQYGLGLLLTETEW